MVDQRKCFLCSMNMLRRILFARVCWLFSLVQHLSYWFGSCFHSKSHLLLFILIDSAGKKGWWKSEDSHAGSVGERQGCSWHTHKVCAVYIGDLSLLLGQTLALHRERNQTKGQERSITGFSLEGGVSLHG